MMHRTKIIYLTAKPGVGKYTIAKALSKHGFIICDNQLVNNPIFELLNYDGFTPIPEFAWDAIARIRNNIFDFIAAEKENSYILTNNLYDDEGDRQLYQQVKQMAEIRNSLFVPIRLLISPEEHLKRVTQPERRLRWKSVDSNEVYDNTPLLKIEDPNFLELDVSKLSANLAAEQILEHVKNIVSK
jgi:hypothetical protein